MFSFMHHSAAQNNKNKDCEYEDMKDIKVTVLESEYILPPF